MAKLTKKHKLVAYILNKDEDFGYSQQDIAKLMNVSQSTISNAAREVEYLREISDLNGELRQTREYLEKQGIFPSSFPVLKS